MSRTRKPDVCQPTGSAELAMLDVYMPMMKSSAIISAGRLGLFEALSGGPLSLATLADKINSAFGSLDGFKEQFAQAGTTQFGSGWAWLIEGDSGLEITKTANADLPLKHGQKALLTMDVWEHAYYLDFQNKRPDYIKTFLDNLVNWDFANQNLAKA